MKKLYLPAFLMVFLAAGISMASGASPALQGYQKANKLFAEAKYREALPLYQKALVAPPENVPRCDVHSRIGDTYFHLNDYRNSLESYRSAIKDQKPADRPQTQYWIGFCSFLAGRDTDAVDEFLKIPRLYPEASMWVTTAYYWAGRASERMGRKDQAAEYYKKAGGNGKSTQGRYAMKKAEAVNGAGAK